MRTWREYINEHKEIHDFDANDIHWIAHEIGEVYKYMKTDPDFAKKKLAYVWQKVKHHDTVKDKDDKE